MSAIDPVDADLYAPPDDETVNRAINDYARSIRDAYGERVKGIYLFGSRARGDHTRKSDADIAVVIEDGEWRNWPEVKRLTDIAYSHIVATGADLEAWPVRASEWDNPTLHPSPDLVRSMHQDARPIWQADA